MKKTVSILIIFFSFSLLSSALRAEIILGKKGSFADAPTGYWKDVGGPEGWVPSNDKASLYTTSGAKFIQISLGVTLSYNTEKKVTADTRYLLKADLGGMNNPSVYAVLTATEKSDGTGNSIELIRITRDVEGTNTYVLITVSNTCLPAKNTIGYYLRVELGLDSGSIGYFRNIYVSATTKGKSAEKKDFTLLGSEKPAFTEGKIICGTKSIGQKQMSPPYQAHTICVDTRENDTSCYGNVGMNVGSGDINPLFFLERKEQQIENSIVYTSTVRENNKSDIRLGTYRLSLTYLENGFARVEAKCGMDNPALLKKMYYYLIFPKGLELTGEYSEEGEMVKYISNKNVSFSGEQLEGMKFVFYTEKEEYKFALYPEQCSNIQLYMGRLTLLCDDTGTISFLIDISGAKSLEKKTETAPNGVNIWDADRCHFPDYDASGNLVQNPSFEAGLRFWGYNMAASGAMPLKYTNIYELDETIAHTGRNSLRIRAIPMDTTLLLGNYPVPCRIGESYTLSFYAKSSAAEGLTLIGRGRAGEHSKPFGPITNRSYEVGTFTVGKEWKRYSFPFTSLNQFLTINFFAKATGEVKQSAEYIWVDDVQINKGGLIDFQQAPCSVQLTSTARGNFLEFGKGSDFKFIIQSKAETSGLITVSVEDFFFQTIFQKEIHFKTDTNGKTVITLRDLDETLWNKKLRGVFSVSSVLKMDSDDREYRDFFRFSVMNFMENKHKNKNIFGLVYTYGNTAGGPDFERFLTRQRASGFGSEIGNLISYGTDIDHSYEEERIKLMKYYGIEQLGYCLVQLFGSGVVTEGAFIMTNIKNMINPTEIQLAEYARICEIKAKNRPWINAWWMDSESTASCQPLESHPEAYAKFNLATLMGIKKGNPAAKVFIDGGPWTIAKDSGLLWVQRYIQSIKKVNPNAQFDYVGGHFYCDIPENYDLDENISEYIKMLDRNGCSNLQLLFGEGMNYSQMNIPSLGISPYIAHSLNAWYTPPFTYHIGRAERISATFSARSWLVALKYQNRMKSMVDFNTPSRIQDIDFSPRAFDKIPNTLGRLLGDASFYKDIRPVPYVRCYVFKEDKTGAPIAVLWGHKESVDRWKEEAPVYQFDFKNQKVTFIDLMENETSFAKNQDGNTLIPATPFPLFIKGMPGSEMKLCEAIAAAKPATGAIAAVEVALYPEANGGAKIKVMSKVSKDYSGEIKTVVNGAGGKWKMTVAAMGTKEETIVPPQTAEYGKVLPFKSEYSLPEGITGKVEGTYLILKEIKSDITVNGDISDWKNVPGNDVSADITVKTAMVNKKLMICVSVQDKGVNAADTFNGTGIYLNPFTAVYTWSEPQAVSGISGSLGIYELQKAKDGSLEALCSFSQGVLAGMDPVTMIVGKTQKLIVTKTGQSGGRAWIEMEIPERVFAPYKFESGSRFGLNISVPAKDGVRTLAPIGGYKSVNEPGNIHFVMVLL